MNAELNADDRYYMMADEIVDLKREVKELQSELSKLENRIAAEGFSDLETMISKYKTVMLAANELSIEADEEIESLKARLAEAERRESEWIKVTDMLPEDDTSVLTVSWTKYMGRTEPDIRTLHFSKIGEYELESMESVFYFRDSEYGNCPVDDVTHWQPLPQPPKGEEE